MTRVSSRAIIFLGGKVLLIHRVRDSLEYWVTPGGKVEEGETLEEAVKREVKEEIGIDVDVGEKVLEVTNRVYDENNEQHFFLCMHRAGRLGDGTDEKILRPDPNDFSEIVSVNLEEIQFMNVVPAEVKTCIADTFERMYQSCRFEAF